MLNFLIIFGVWITPGIILFLYLLWTIKRSANQSVEVEAPPTQAHSRRPENDTSAIELQGPAALAPARIRERA
jgi:hypothetical protein